jgi:hypothetical protein
MNADEMDEDDVALRAESFEAKQSPIGLRLLRRREHPPRNDARKSDLHVWAARLLIVAVVAWNLQCALVFFLHPGIYAPGFELTGIQGEAAMRGFAVLFVMWNIPYLVALWHPLRQRGSLWEALAMQVVGLIGESLILFSLPAGHPSLHASILRFIAFDGAGVVLLIGSVVLVNKGASNIGSGRIELSK